MNRFALLFFSTLLVFLAPTELEAEPKQKAPLYRIDNVQGESLRVSEVGKKGAPRSFLSLAESLLPGQARRFVFPMSQKSLLCIWQGRKQAAYSLLRLRGGKLVEEDFGAWPWGWYPKGHDDFNGDKKVDFLVVKWTGAGDSKKYSYGLALQTGDKSFQLKTHDDSELVRRARGAYFCLGDITGDGKKDLLFHSFRHGGSYQTQIFMQKGLGKGRFGEVQALAGVRSALTNITAGDFNGDGRLDLFLPPDDDAADDGQSFLHINSGKPNYFGRATESIDFLPKSEGSGSDSFAASARCLDYNQDGKLDLLVCQSTIGQSRRWSIFHGDGRGKFRKETLVKKVKWGQPYSVTFLFGEKAKKGPKKTTLKKEALSALWLKLGSADIQEAAQALSQFQSAGASIVDYFVGQLTRKGPNPQLIETLIRDLNAISLERRDKATKELASYGDLISEPLERALKSNPHPEARYRLTVLLKVIERAKDSLQTDISRRNHRSIRLLELLSSEAAKKALTRLSKSATFGSARDFAKDALKRLDSD